MVKKVANWGNFPLIEGKVSSFNFTSEASALIKSGEPLIGRGNGRCYGDSSLASHMLSTLKHNRLLSFDPQAGVIECESGTLFSDLLEFLVPKGWFLPVTPGTKFITVGGAIASDVHGKNHHVDGSFSNHLIEFSILTESGDILICNKTQNQDLFRATCGGMGLTGLLLTAKFSLKKIETAYIRQIQKKARNLEEILEYFEAYKGSTYSMAWIDCLKGGKGFGRSIMMAGEHARIDELPKSKSKQPLILKPQRKLSIPFKFPSFVLNKWSIKLFNTFYYHKNFKKEINNLISYEPFFYPLDSILEWNNMYGKKGFVQYQFVLPLETSKEGLIRILNEIRKKGEGSFLAVLKLFGKQDDLISFPMEGYTLALDFPVKKNTLSFLDELDKIVLEHRGRIYLTKDARMKEQVFNESYPNLEEFKAILRNYNSSGKFRSEQSKRLQIL